MLVKTTLLFFLTAIAEIVGCFLPWLWLKKGMTAWLFAACSGESGVVCLVADAASGSKRSRLRGLRGCLCGDGADLAARGGWRQAQYMGLDWRACSV